MIEHTSEIRVRYAETDQMRFAHHSNYITWFELARINLLREIGISYAQLEKDGYLMPVLEVSARYIRAAHFDDRLFIKAVIEEEPRAKLAFKYEVYDEQGELLCTGHSMHSFMNRKERAVKPPASFLTRIRELMKQNSNITV